MIRNYFKIAFRNLLRNKTFSAINIVGLSIGIASCLVILLYVRHEFSFDRFNRNYDRIYRVAEDLKSFGTNERIAFTSAKLGPAMKENLSEVQNYARVLDLDRFSKPIVRYEEKSYYTPHFIYSDSSFFNIFSYKLLEGNPSNVLSAPFSIILTKSMAMKYFGDQNAIGKVIQVLEGDTTLNFTITGIAADPPGNSSLQFSCVASMGTLYHSPLGDNFSVDYWGAGNFYNYIMLTKNQPAAKLESELPRFLNGLPNFREEIAGFQESLFLQPLKDIHLYSHLEYDLPSNVNVDSLYIFSAIAFSLLLIACVNFMNLSTARYTKRAKEVGVRKVMGAGRTELVRQFLGESIIISLISTAFAVALVETLLPLTEALTGSRLSMSLLGSIDVPLGLALIATLTGLLAGLYPAIFLTSFEYASILKSPVKSIRGGGFIRKGFVLFQFTVSVALIITAIVVQGQLNYVRNANLGFDRNDLVVIPLSVNLPKEEAMSRLDVYRSEITQNSSVTSVTAVSECPGSMEQNISFQTEGSESKTIMINVAAVDSNYLKTLGMETNEGSTSSNAHTKHGIILNESAAKELGFKNPIGEELITGWGGMKGTVVGVIKDFKFESLRNRVGPLVLIDEPGHFHYLICRVDPQNYQSTLKYLKEKWQEVYPGIPFDYSFLDSDLGRLYSNDARFGGTANIFAGLAIVIACLGLFGLASSSAEKRTKEIGIRKVLGASVESIVELMSREFLGLVLLANVVAWPVAYYAMNKWLQGFAYRINLDIWIFVLAGLTVLAISMITVSYQAIRAANANPVERLRHE